MQDNLPETTHVSMVSNVVAILLLQHMVRVMLFPTINVLYFYINTSRSTYVCSDQYGCFP
jgi:hypothetical protein